MNSDDNFAGRAIPLGLLGGGIAYSGYKAYTEYGNPFDKLADTIKKAEKAIEGSSSLPRPRTRATRPAFQEKLLQDAFEAADSMMSSSGKQEFLNKVYERALYRTGITDSSRRQQIISDLSEAGTNWGDVRSRLGQYEHQIGGLESVYQEFRSVAGRGKRLQPEKTAAAVVRSLKSPATKKPYLMSDFESGNSFWGEMYAGTGGKEIVPGLTSASQTDFDFGRKFANVANVPVQGGIRSSSRSGGFQFQRKGNFASNIPGVDGTSSYIEYKVGGGKMDNFFQMPLLPEARSLPTNNTPSSLAASGKAFVASDRRGMSFSSVPHFAIGDPGGNHKLLDWNQFLDVAMFGSTDHGIEGYAQKIHRYQQEGKSLRILSDRWNTMVSSMMQKYTGTSGSLAQARMHMMQVVDARDLIAGTTPTMERTKEFYNDMAALLGPENVGAPGSPGQMATATRLMMKDLPSEWDIFAGINDPATGNRVSAYPMERRYTSRYRSLGLTDKAASVVKNNKILGILSRETPLTYTKAGSKFVRETGHTMPSVVGYFSLKEASHLRPEEGFIGQKIKDMVEVNDIETIQVRSGVGRDRWVTEAYAKEHGVSGFLEHNEEIGFDYRTGEAIRARNVKGQIQQRVLDVKVDGDITSVRLETVMPLQDQAKAFGLKIQFHKARGHGVGEEMLNEYGVKGDAIIQKLIKQNRIEVVASAEAFKKIGPEIHKQMSEASWYLAGRHMAPLTAKGVPRKQQQMWRFVHDEKSRTALLESFSKNASKRWGKDTNLGVGIELLKRMKKWGMNQEELGLIGGLFYDTYSKDYKLDKILAQAGFEQKDISALKNAEGVIAMPSMHLGDIASQYPWKGGSLDPRAIREIRAQGKLWGGHGDAIISELVGRLDKDPGYNELAKAASSMAEMGVDKDIEKITSLRKARAALGERGFNLEYQGKSVYVPGPEVKSMGRMVGEVGEEIDRPLRGAYSRYFNALGGVNEYGGEAELRRLEGAENSLRGAIHDAYASGRHLGGSMVGFEAPMARSMLPRSPQGKALTEMFEGKTIEEATNKFLANSKMQFTTGVGKKTARRMINKLIDAANDPEEIAWLKRQEEKLFSGQTASGIVFRHPSHKVQSTLPTKIKVMMDHDEGVFFPKISLKAGDTILDVSGAFGMNLDTDGDHAVVSIVSKAKTSEAVEDLLASDEWRKRFVQDVQTKHGLQKLASQAAIRGDTGAQKAIIGLERLAGSKLVTGPVSSLITRMKASTAFVTSDEVYTDASQVLNILEESPISAKHGLLSGDAASKIKHFVNGTGTDIEKQFHEVWMATFKAENITIGDVEYNRDKFTRQVADYMGAAEDSAEGKHFVSTVMEMQKAHKGREFEAISAGQMKRFIELTTSGKGDIMSDMRQAMLGEGPGSMLEASRGIMDQAGNLGNLALRSFKKHWKVPAMAAGLAVASSILLNSGGSINMQDHNTQVTNLAHGSGVPNIPPPNTLTQRVVTGAGGAMPAGISGRMDSDFTSQGLRDLQNFASDVRTNVLLRDNRGAITPEYIDKAQRERYN